MYSHDEMLPEKDEKVFVFLGVLCIGLFVEYGSSEVSNVDDWILCDWVMLESDSDVFKCTLIMVDENFWTKL